MPVPVPKMLYVRVPYLVLYWLGVCQATVDIVGPTIIPAGECFEVSRLSKAAAEDCRLAAMENQ